MKIPSNVQKIVDASLVDPSLKYVELLGTIRKQPCLRLFAYKHTKTHGKQVKEVGRRFIDRDMLTGSFYYTRLGGYQVVFKKSKRIGYYTIEVDDHFYVITDRDDIRYPKRYFNRLYKAKEVENLFKGIDEWLKYLIVPELTEIDDTMEYLRTYRDHPMLERLARAGFAYLYDSKQLYRLGEQKSRELASFLKKNRGFIVNHRPNLGWMLNAIKARMSAEDYEFQQKTEELYYRFEHDLKFELNLCKEMCLYVLKQASDIDTYCDYIRFCKQAGMNINDRGILFPKSLAESHNGAMIAADEKVNKKTNKGLKKAVEILRRYIGNTGEFQLVLPKTKSDLIQWGNALHSCIGKMDYGEKMAKGDTIIIGVFLNGQIIECCEIGNNHKNEIEILQLRGEHNQDSPYHKQAASLANQFLAQYKPQNLLGAVI